jgi:transposase
MSMQTPFAAEIPEETRRLVGPLLTADSVYRLVGNEIDQIISDEDFLDMYAGEGRPAVNPVVLALVSIFQFLEKLPDRAAAEAVVMRLDWKYALRQELTWTGFHYSDLCNFRKRLLEHGREWVVFERLVAYLRERGYIKGRGKQRTAATKILGYVARLSHLELVWETIRLALGALVRADASWVGKYVPVSFVDTYSQRRWDFRVGKAKIQQRMREAGQEGYWLLEQVEGQGSDELKALVESEQLRRVLEEQFTRREDGKMPPRPRRQAKGDVITTPHDLEVRYGYKGGQGWVGYKLQVTETADEGPRFITDVEIVPAMQRRAICPAGKTQVKWAKTISSKNLTAYLAWFGSQRGSCPHFGPGLCTDRPNGRCLSINAYHDVIQARRLETNTEAFRQEMHIRAGIEGTVSEMVRSHGLRRSCFRGTRKNHLQALFGAAAVNLKRLAHRLSLLAFIRSRPHSVPIAPMA